MITENSSTDKRNLNKKINKNSNVFIYIGRLIEAKGPDKFLKACIQLIEENKAGDSYFVIGGPGNLLPSIKKEAKKYSDRIFVLGDLNYKQVTQLYNNSNVYVLPTKHHEGLPLSIIEAGATKNLVMVTAVGGIKEVINKNTGYFIKPTVQSIKKGIVWYLNNKKQANVLVNNLHKKVVKDHTINVTAKKFYDVITK